MAVPYVHLEIDGLARRAAFFSTLLIHRIAAADHDHLAGHEGAEVG